MDNKKRSTNRIGALLIYAKQMRRDPECVGFSREEENRTQSGIARSAFEPEEKEKDSPHSVENKKRSSTEQPKGTRIRSMLHRFWFFFFWEENLNCASLPAFPPTPTSLLLFHRCRFPSVLPPADPGGLSRKRVGMGNATKRREQEQKTQSKTGREEKRAESRESRTRCMNSYLFFSLTLSDLEERQNCLQDRAGNGKGR